MESEGKMLKAEEVATSKVTSIKQEAENDTRTIEDPPNPRRVSMSKPSAGLPPPAPKFQVPDLHETHGPILPVERKHQFPKDPPARVESKAKDDFKFPVMVEEGGHSFAEVPKAGEKVAKLTGPVLEVSHSHSFKAAEAQKFDYKTLQSPAFTVGVEAGHKFNVIESAQKPVANSLPGDQKFPVMDVSHDSKFTGPTTSIKSSNTEVKDLQYPTMMNKRRFNNEKSGHSYSADLIQGQESKVTTDLIGPLYDVNVVHAFKGIMTHAHQLSEISGPVYGVEEREHHYSELGKHAEALKNLTMPVYDIDKGHHFEVIMKEAEKIMQVNGPVLPCDHANKFRPESKKIDTDMPMTTPKFPGVSDKNQYNPQSTKVQSEPLMTGPVFSQVTAKNNYNIVEGIKIEADARMNAPVYSGAGNMNQFTYEAPKVPEGTPQMFTPKPAGVVESHNFNPMTERVSGVPQQSYPVIQGVDSSNQYSHVPERKQGQLATVGPVYAGVEHKSSYTEVGERVNNQPLQSGPVRPGVDANSKFNIVQGKADLAPIVTGPCYPTDAGHKFSGETLEPKFDLQKTQMYPVMDTGHQHAFREIIASAAAMAGFMPSRHDYDIEKHHFVYEAPKQSDVSELLGPIYDVMAHHNYGQIDTIVSELKTLATPVYTPESKNHYQAILKDVEKLENLKTPVFDISRDHHYSEIMKNIESIKSIKGPVYDLGQDSKHHCSEIVQTVERIKQLSTPVLVEGKSNYNEMQKQVETLKNLSGPIYDIGELKYNFNEIEKHAESIKDLNFPVLVTGDSKHCFNEIAKHAEELKDLIGPVYLSEDVGHKFSVVPPKFETPHDVNGPVYLTEDARHKYSEFIKQVEGRKYVLCILLVSSPCLV